MELEFATKQMTSAMKAVKRMFDKGPFNDADPGCQDCLVASSNDSTALLESATAGLYIKAQFPADVRQEGRVAIGRSTLHALRLLGDRSTFRHAPGTAQLAFKSGQFEGELAVGEAFEEIEASRPANIPDLTISMPALTAKAAAKRTCMTATLDTLLRMKLTVASKVMTLSCNDSFRAAAVRSRLDDASEGEGEIEVPAVFFNTVVQSIEDSLVRIGFNDRMFRVSGGGFDVCHPVMQDADRPMVDVFGRLDALKSSGPPVVSATVDSVAVREAIAAVTSVAPANLSGDVPVSMQFTPASQEGETAKLTTSVRSATSQGKFVVPLRALHVCNAQQVLISSKFLTEMFNLMATDDVDLHAWDRIVVLQSEKVGCCMFMPQIINREE